ncbi:hypothetical protein [Actinacidiphila rubida]|uniref:Uncharacterized protein n=1 Tax=Actinacidiphila rubida TaxID=310780 RepID=A0A1H8JGF6_9ACTN|nr:hypothetical protein [Actinacidiphila rubida]SEN79884.1 hypothetical protein SAMN05216267_1010110 [Actinacidiphila rubida]
MAETTPPRAAYWLDQQLTQLIAKLDVFIRLRTDQRKALLGHPHSDNWQGAKRRNFDTTFKQQHDALVALKTAAASLQKSVAQVLADDRKPHH